jgi:hypothetical protein
MMLTAPAVFYNFLLASFFGSLFHFWKGGTGGRLLLNLILSWMGFALGHGLGELWETSFLMIGPIHSGLGTAGSLLLLFIGHGLSKLEESSHEFDPRNH